MALPTLSKSWQYSWNMGIYTTLQELLYAWKTRLTTWASAPWVVMSSCGKVGGITWTYGAADYWLSSDAIVHDPPGSSHAWIVLKQSGIASNFQVCFDCIDDGGGNPSVTMVYVSYSAGFSGGTETNRPTATDEVPCQYSTNTPNWAALGTALRMHMFQSIDGECTRWSIWNNGTHTCFWALDKPKNPMPGWAQPWVSIGASRYYGGPSSQVSTYANLNTSSQYTTVSPGGTNSQYRAYLTSEGIYNVPLGVQQTIIGDFDLSYPLFPMGIYNTFYNQTPPLCGFLGEVYDLWWGAEAVSDGMHYPADASRQLVQMNDIVHPWGGGPQMMTRAY